MFPCGEADCDKHRQPLVGLIVNQNESPTGTTSFGGLDLPIFNLSSQKIESIPGRSDLES
jgi:hypothetical protein